MSLLEKKLSELTAEEIQSLAKPVGIAGMPYPMVTYTKDGQGEMQQQIGVIDSIGNAMTVYTEMPIEQVMGKLFREMPIPSMLPMLRDLMAKEAPDSKNRIFTVFGDPAFGKSFLFKSFASIVHPQGAIQVDCGGMNMREIFFRTVIDYGAGVQDVLDKRLAEGKVSQTSIDYMKARLGAAIVEKDGKVALDWNMVGASEGSENETAESGQARIQKAMNDAVEALRHVYEKEGITHESNSFGIKTVPGEFFEAMWSGRPLFLDEFNKSKRGTLDSWQTALQFLNGEEDSVTIYNPMSQSGDDDSMKAITVTRADIKAGFIVGVAGNEMKDGDTTQELSASMMTRLNPMYVGNPTIRDWEHRISQVWTGLPLVTLHSIFQEFATNKPVEFTDFLMDLRKMGLSAEEQAAIPNKEIYFLQNWQETIDAVKQVSEYYNFRAQLSDTESTLFDQDAYQDLADEINTDAAAKMLSVSFRKVIADNNKAMEGVPDVNVTITSQPNIREALDPSHLASAGVPDPGWHRFGENLSRAIIEDIVNVTKDMPKTRAALLTICTEKGIVSEVFKEGRASDSVKELSDLMKYDELKDLGGTDETRAVRDVIMVALKAIDPKIVESDESVVPLRNLATILQTLKAEEETKSKNKAKIKKVITVNDDIDRVKAEPLVMVEAVSNYTEASGGEDGESMDYRAVLAAMALPDYADKNREKLWLHDLIPYLKQAEAAVPEGDDPVFNTLTGKSENGFHLAIAAATNEKKEPVYLYVLEDKKGEKAVIVGPETIPEPLRSALEKNGVEYLVKTDSGTKKKIDDFLTEGTRNRQNEGQIAKGTSNTVTESLIAAFGYVSEFPQKYLKVENGETKVKENTTLGAIIVDADSEPAMYTRFVKKPGAPRI